MGHGVGAWRVGLLKRFVGWGRRDRFASVDGLTACRVGLSGARQPALFISGAADLLAPPAAVRAGYDLWAGEKEYWNAGREAGVSVDYGHSDLIFGRRGPEASFPRVEQWAAAPRAKAPPPPVP